MTIAPITAEGLGHREEQAVRARRLLLALGLLEVDVPEALDLGGLGVGGADDAHAGERLLEDGRERGG